ncbi:cytochrome P450- family 76- subfamily G-polypeptide 1 [Striga hermonthica]|uniref:Flavonoid-6-hydroxylase n=1 Tax=Striga hermonthica TaxID=68872 RepID=A0A9N7NJS5_STRHE|nr:cytochrome P450- family 76- subfamily G-polypeptide 1 [Striga hermonthica]
MDWPLNSLNPLTTSLLVVLLLLGLLFIRPKPAGKTPPGPRGIPILGNLLQLGDLPHESMHRWRGPHGPVLWLKLGAVGTMVVQSSTSAAELFKKHDLAFADRKVPDVITAFDFSIGTLSMSRFGPYWRALRRLCSAEFSVSRRVNETAGLRHRLRGDMERWILEESAADRARGGMGAVQLSRFLFLMAFNLMGNLMLSMDLLDAKDPESRQFFDCMSRAIELEGTPNIADYLPWLKWMDPLGMKREMKRNLSVAMRITSGFIKERLEERKAGKARETKDFLDVLLEYEGDGKDGPERITEKNVNIVITEMFFAGSETTSISIEWGFAELLRSPHAFKKVREELDRVVGVDRRVEEKDIENMPYLQAVVKEAFRLHPVVPLLLPRNAQEDTNYMGYHIPKDTQVFVNVWSIGRDPEVWPDPLDFRPERFLGSNIEYKGQHFELIPFGSGRRICVGFMLAHRMVHLAMATLVQSFEWDLGPGVKPEDIDREERLGLALRKKNPLFVIPTKRINC